MFAHSPWYVLSIRKFSALAVIIFCGATAALSEAATVDIHQGDDIPTVVAANPAGTKFVIYPGTYRLTEHIVPKDGDIFIGQTACAPPTTSCPAILSGSTVIGPLAKLSGTNYEVTGQTQQGTVTEDDTVCQPGYLACNLPEDLFFDGKPYLHLYATSLPIIGAGQWWFDYTKHIIYFHDNPAGHTVETSVLDTAFDSKANNVTVQYLTIKGFASPLQQAGLEPSTVNISLSASLNWVITNCELFNNHGVGVRVAFGTQIYNSYIHDNGTVGVGGGTDSTADSGIIIQGNTITYNNYAHMLPAAGAGGLKFGYTAGAVVRGNTITNNDGPGIHFDSSSENPIIDGNVIKDNAGGGGIAYEISLNSALIRNNVLLGNGIPDAAPVSASSIGSLASIGVLAYCNVLELPDIGSAKPGSGANGIMVGASNRGNNQFPPYEYLMSQGNAFHHNTVIWDDDNARGTVGYLQVDAAHQPNFFADNPPPDYNTYHLPKLSATPFIYDNNNTQKNMLKTFAEYQAAGADIHGTADTNYTSGYPAVAITSPADQSSFTNSVTIESTASDKSGIEKVEFYVDWKLDATVESPPYNFSWTNGTTGWHTVAAMAYSNAGIRTCNAVSLKKQ